MKRMLSLVQQAYILESIKFSPRALNSHDPSPLGVET